MIFTKYHGIGNDFILVDQRKSPIEKKSAFFAQIPRICDRHLGIGADGVLLLENSKCADLKMRIFNSDGSEADMCGNGIRCVADYEMAQKPIEIETRSGVFTCWRKEGQIGVDLKQPLICHWPMKIHEFAVYVVKVGVPHAVVFLPSFGQIDLIKTAQKIRSAFSGGVNVNFASSLNNQLIVRTYERGVENETISCGTGFAAVAFVVSKLSNPPQPILIASASDKISKQMKFFISASGNIQMLAEACQVFSGSLELS